MRPLLAATIVALVLATGAASAAPPQADVRFATFNASLNRPTKVPLDPVTNPTGVGLLTEQLADPNVDDQYRRQAKNVAEVIQRIQPDVLLVNEFDPLQNGDVGVSPGPENLFRTNFLEEPQNGAAPIEYPYAFIAASNTGVPTGKDLNGNGVVGATPGTQAYGDDSFGFGLHPGHFGMVVFSKYPIDYANVRTFRLFKWKDMPGNLIPTPFYSPDEVEILRLSSKSHWDVPIQIGDKTVHFLVSHPTPPVFDGPEDRNGRRNHDEIRFWADYVTPGKAGYIYDDAGGRGGLKPGELFVIAGDQNSDPLDGDSVPGAIQQLTEHPLVNTKLTPASAGAVEATALQGGANTSHRSDPQFDTADFADSAPGNLRADYVLPRKTLQLVDAGVFWPLRDDPLFRLTGVFDFGAWGLVGGFPTSDHRSVWIDVTVPGVKWGGMGRAAPAPPGLARGGTIRAVPDLATLGWDSAWSSAFEPHAQEGLVPGRVAVQHRGEYDVLTADGERRSRITSRLRRESRREELPIVGDWVALDPAGSITAVLPRRTTISRRAAHEPASGVSREQVIAANVDVAFVVHALGQELDPRLIERYVALAVESGARPVVLLTKTDLEPEADSVVAAIADLGGDIPVLLVSARSRAGLDAVRTALPPGSTGALLGPSGVGKSTLVNALVGDDARLATGEIGDDGAGRHTTTRRELVLLPEGGMIVDNPGMREVYLWIEEESLVDAFDDIAEVALSCRFTDCRHETEPGCAVRAALEVGELSQERFERYRTLERELAELADRLERRERSRARRKPDAGAA